jgi:predicted  nucleic acid-binding Zn-ribbon protein
MGKAGADKMPKRATDATKKCPYCSSYVKLNADRCDACNRRIGPANAYGIAKKPVNIMSYMVAIVAVAGLAAYMIWAFAK